MRTFKMGSFIFAIVLIICCLFTNSVAKANYEIQMDDIKVAKEAVSPSINRHVITNQPLELYGPEQEATFYYEIRSTVDESGNELVLKLKHSELLIEPSSVSVSIDDEKVKTIALNNEQLTNQLTIPLTGNHLSKGFHKVTVSFHGILKEGVCVDQETSGNYLMIGIDSYIQLSGEVPGEASLSDYPSLFTMNGNANVTIVLPDLASLGTRNSGTALGAFLAERANVEIIRESKLETVKGNLIFIGAQDEFVSEKMKKLLSKAEVKAPAEGLVLSLHHIVGNGGTVDSLIVTGKSPEQIEKRMEILLNEQYSKQLIGQKMEVKSEPAKTTKENGEIVTFKSLGVGNLTFDRFNKKSETYFGYAPSSIPNDKNAQLELRLKRSETLGQIDEELSTSVTNQAPELVIFVNEIPHSINLQNLGEEEDGIYTVTLPIERNVIKNNRMISLSFEANGLRVKNPCFSFDDNRWVYVMDDSFISFPNNDAADVGMLSSFPFPFSELSKKMMIILPAAVEVDDDDLLTLYNSLVVNGRVPLVELADGGQLKDDELGDQHLLFIGGLANQPVLEKHADDLIVSHKTGVPNFQPFGFLQEAVDYYSWMQESPFSKDHLMMMIGQMGETEKKINDKLLDSIKNLEDPATIAVQTKDQRFYTNAMQVSSMAGELKSKQTQTEGKESVVWWFVGFASLLIMILIVLIVVKRNRERNRLEV